VKLSEAIREGAKRGPQAKGAFTETPRRRLLDILLRRPVAPKAYCALGAAYEAENGGAYEWLPSEGGEVGFRGGPIAAGSYSRQMKTPPEWPMHTWAKCPECQAVAMPLAQLIPHLNDTHEWTRERIADFVEGVESLPRAVSVVGNSRAETLSFDND